MRVEQRVCAVVVTYHPDAAVMVNLAEVRGQVDGMVVVDNGSDSEVLRGAKERVGFVLVENGENLGIGVALNRGGAVGAGAGVWVGGAVRPGQPGDGRICGGDDGGVRGERVGGAAGDPGADVRGYEAG